MDERMAMELAASQHSLITYDQARSLGLTRHQIQHRLDERMWDRVHEGVYRSAAAPGSRTQRLLAACLAAGPISAASHRSAAAAHGLWTMPQDWTEISVGRDRSPELVGVTTHRLADLSTRWVIERDGLPVTTPARTLVDLGAVLPLGSVSRAMDRAIGHQLATLTEMRSALHAVARKGRAGVGVMRRLLKERGDAPNTSSTLQARMSTLIRRHALLAPVPEHTVFDGRGQFVGTVDFAYPEIKYAIEVDGYEFHAGVREFRHDRVRQNDLVDLGWTVHRFTWTEVDQLSPRVADRIRHRYEELLGTLNPITAA
jgi:hypothetical protein